MCWGKAQISQEQVTCTSHWHILQTERHHRSLLALSPELLMGDIYCPKRIVSSVETDKQNYSKPSGNSSTCRYRTGWTLMTGKCFSQTFKLNICEMCFWSCYNFCSCTKIWAIKVSFLPQFTETQATAQKDRMTDRAAPLGMPGVALRHLSSPLLLDTGIWRWGSFLVTHKTFSIYGSFPNRLQHPWGCPWNPEVRL